MGLDLIVDVNLIVDVDQHMLKYFKEKKLTLKASRPTGQPLYGRETEPGHLHKPTKTTKHEVAPWKLQCHAPLTHTLTGKKATQDPSPLLLQTNKNAYRCPNKDQKDWVFEAVENNQVSKQEACAQVDATPD